jgi:hypothetical protein
MLAELILKILFVTHINHTAPPFYVVQLAYIDCGIQIYILWTKYSSF